MYNGGPEDEAIIEGVGGKINITIAPSNKRVYMICTKTLNGDKEVDIILDKKMLLQLKNALSECLNIIE
jgi:hypothetical protein